MKLQISLLLSSLLLTGSAFGQSPQLQDKPIIQAIDSLVQTLLAKKQTVGFMLGIQHGSRKPFLKEYGLADVRAQKPVMSTSKFRIASLTKPFTAVAVMRLIETGQLNLQDKLSRFFKHYPKGDSITIYQLLSHTSGIPNWWEGEMPASTPADFPMCKSQHLYLQDMKKPFLFEPGTKHSYSNSGYVLLGEIIEQVTGMHYIDYLHSAIFKPAGLHHTLLDEGIDRDETWAKGYQKTNDTLFTEPKGYTMPFSAGSLRSNPEDLIKFLDALYQGKIIKKSTLAQMTTYALTRSGTPVYDAMYFPATFTPPPPPAYLKKYGYGLGFTLMEIYGTAVVWHSGGIAGFNSILLYLPKSKTKIILLANTENGVIPIWEQVQKQIIKFE